MQFFIAVAFDGARAGCRAREEARRTSVAGALSDEFLEIRL
jgi:hypothetical protein